MISRRLANPMQIRVVAAFLAIYVVWGSTYFAIKVAVQTIPPLTAAGIRFLIAGTMVYGWARLRGAPRPSRSQRSNLAMLGALMFVPCYASLFWAERTVPSGVAAVLIATLPLWTVLVEAALVKGRRVTPGLIAALAPGFIGVLLLALGSDGVGGVIPWLPCIAIIFGEMAWAFGSVITARLDMPGSSMVTSGAEMTVGGTLLLLCGGAIGEWHRVTVPTPPALAAMTYLILAGSIVAFNAYIWLLGRTSATRLSSFSYVNPVVALALGYAFAGEHLTSHALWASVLVLASVVLVQRATRRRDDRLTFGQQKARERKACTLRAAVNVAE
jgi:drug/metabolite transporter (DMT)-like permease